MAGVGKTCVADDVKTAVQIAYRLAEKGDAVLLSPACASWDMYKSFEERGSIFKESVHNLRTSLNSSGNL
jgi:UDP-N-acetylmuramoylalanine--D-glutamate ligase